MGFLGSKKIWIFRKAKKLFKKLLTTKLKI